MGAGVCLYQGACTHSLIVCVCAGGREPILAGQLMLVVAAHMRVKGFGARIKLMSSSCVTAHACILWPCVRSYVCTLSLKPGSGILLPSSSTSQLAAALLSQQGTPVLHELQAILSIETIRYICMVLPVLQESRQGCLHSFIQGMAPGQQEGELASQSIVSCPGYPAYPGTPPH